MKWTKPAQSKPLVGHQLAFLTIVGFWLFYAVIVSLRAAILDYPAQLSLAATRSLVTLCGIGITWLLYLLLRAFDRQKLGRRITVAFVAAIPCALAIAAINYYFFSFYKPLDLMDDPNLARQIKDIQEQLGVTAFQEIIEQAVSRYFFVVAWALLYISISYAREVREAERVTSRFARAAQDAELRSLRYQVNPHFLFNTLNSLSSLVIKGHNDRAEAMIQNLASFYRTSLSNDPLENVTLAEEVELQRRYLEIESIRFPRRLQTDFDIPKELEETIVPALILQPLVENSIKHGVSRSDSPVTIKVSARLTDSHIEISVADDADTEESTDIENSTGIGITNVRDRLEARYGKKATFFAGKAPGGGYVASIFLPKGKTA